MTSISYSLSVKASYKDISSLGVADVYDGLALFILKIIAVDGRLFSVLFQVRV